MDNPIYIDVVAGFMLITFSTWAVICLIWPAKVRTWAMRMTERPAAIRVLRPSQDWARRYVRRPIYIWHTRFVGICALLMAIAIAYAGMLKVLSDR